MKVFELAKELNISSGDLIAVLESMDIKVGNHMALLDDDQISNIKAYFDNNNKTVVEESDIEKENKELKNRLEKMEKMIQSLTLNQITKNDIEDELPEIPMNKTVKVMSLFDGGLNLKTSNDEGGQVFRFTFVGDTFPIIYSDLVKVIANQRSFFKDGYCMILDKNVVKAHYLEDDYKKFVDGKVINSILEYDISKIKDIFANVTSVIQQSIIDIIVKKINTNEYVDKNKVAVISELYGTDIFEFANRIK